MKIIMYHNVKNYDQKLPYQNFLSIKKFKKQLQFFEDKYGLISNKDWKLIEIDFEEYGITHNGEDYEFIYPELVAFAIGDLHYIQGSVERINRVGYTYLDPKEIIEYSILDMAILSKNEHVIEFLIEVILPRKAIIFYNYSNHFILIAKHLKCESLIEVSNYILKNLHDLR